MPEMKANAANFNVQESPVENPLGVESMYVNHANVLTTQWDFRIIMSEVVPMRPKDVHVQLRANVVMTPPHAKAFLNVLKANIEIWEKQNGEIKVPGEPK